MARYERTREEEVIIKAVRLESQYKLGKAKLERTLCRPPKVEKKKNEQRELGERFLAV